MINAFKAVTLVFVCMATLFVVTKWQNKTDRGPEKMVEVAAPQGCLKYHFRDFTHRSTPLFIFKSLKMAPDATIALTNRFGNPIILSTTEITSQTRRRNSVVGKKLKRLATLLQHESRSVIVGDRELKVFVDNTVITGDVPSCTIVAIHFSHKYNLHPDIAETIEENIEALMDEPADALGEEDDIPIAAASSRGIPCDQKGKPRGCVHRIRKWRDIEKDPACQGNTLVTEKSKDCELFNDKDRIRSNLCNGKYYCVKFGGHYNSRRGQRGIIMQAGEHWGTNGQTGANYDCQGRCGAGCHHKRCSNWSRKCMLHDVCSWWYGAKGGPFSWHCGRAFLIASTDYLNCCTCGCTGPEKSTC